MKNKKIKSIEENMETFEEYFREDLAAIDEELVQSKKYSDIINKEIENLSGPSLGLNKGNQHYLIEHINNAVSLQTQRQGLRKDRFAIKKTIMDYASKFSDSDEEKSSENIVEVLNKILENQSAPVKEIENAEDLDSAIDDILNNTDGK